MAKKQTNKNKVWTDEEKQKLQNLADDNTPTRLIAMKMGRTENAIRSQAAKLDLSLKPTNQSPYNRKKPN